LTDARGMRDRTFLDLASRFESTLDGEERARCLYYQGQLQRVQDDELRGLATLQRLIELHPTSPWAGDAAFWLAEHEFEQGRLEQARAGYQAFLQRYPNNPWAATARRWLSAMDHVPQTSRELEKGIINLLNRLPLAKDGLSATLVSGDALP